MLILDRFFSIFVWSTTICCLFPYRFLEKWNFELYVICNWWYIVLWRGWLNLLFHNLKKQRKISFICKWSNIFLNIFLNVWILWNLQLKISNTKTQKWGSGSVFNSHSLQDLLAGLMVRCSFNWVNNSMVRFK